MLATKPDALVSMLGIEARWHVLSSTMKTNGLLIRRKRVELGHGVNRFAAIAGISGPALSRIETGQRQPRPETLKKIADALGCAIADVTPEDPA